MTKTMLKLADYRDRYRGHQAIIVGSGPTTYDYHNLNNFSGPIGFINDALFVIPRHGPDHFFFSHHQMIKRFWNTDVTFLRWPHVARTQFLRYFSIPIINNAKAKRWIDINFKYFNQDFPTFPSWSLDKNYIVKNNQLHVHHGSITGMIHFLWFCGVDNILGIGINPATINKPHDSRIDISPVDPHIAMIIRHQQIYFEHFGIEVEYHA